MISSFGRSLRAAVMAALVLTVFAVPLVHTSHVHYDREHDGTTVHTACVLCAFEDFRGAHCELSVDLPRVTEMAIAAPVAEADALHTILLLSEPGRAPPLA